MRKRLEVRYSTAFKKYVINCMIYDEECNNIVKAEIMLNSEEVGYVINTLERFRESNSVNETSDNN